MKIVLLTVCFSCVKAIDEQEVLSAFVDVYDKMYEIRDDHAKQIEQLNNKDLEKTKQIESLKLQLEEMKKMIAPATCSELWNQAKICIMHKKHGSSSFSLWQYRLWSFQAGGTKLDRFLHKNQHTQRKLLNLEFWIKAKLLLEATFFVIIFTYLK